MENILIKFGIPIAAIIAVLCLISVLDSNPKAEVITYNKAEDFYEFQDKIVSKVENIDARSTVTGTDEKSLAARTSRTNNIDDMFFNSDTTAAITTTTIVSTALVTRKLPEYSDDYQPPSDDGSDDFLPGADYLCGSWTTSALGASCDTACVAIGSTCDPICQRGANTEEQVNAALAIAGGFKAVGVASCSSWSDDGSDSMHGPVDPSYYSGSGCNYASGATSNCAATDSNRYRLCACLPPPPTGNNFSVIIGGKAYNMNAIASSDILDTNTGLYIQKYYVVVASGFSYIFTLPIAGQKPSTTSPGLPSVFAWSADMMQRGQSSTTKIGYYQSSTWVINGDDSLSVQYTGGEYCSAPISRFRSGTVTFQCSSSSVSTASEPSPCLYTILIADPIVCASIVLTAAPTAVPSAPSSPPSLVPSTPTFMPSMIPSVPSVIPSSSPSVIPSIMPTLYIPPVPFLWFTFGTSSVSGITVYNQGSGGSTYNAALKNGATTSMSVSITGNGALVLTGNAKQYLSIPAMTFGATGISFAVWFMSNNNQQYARIFDFGNAQENVYLGIYGANDLVVDVYSEGSGSDLALGNPVNDNRWMHLVWTLSPTGSSSVYINGQFFLQLSTVQYPTILSSANNLIGRSNWPLPYYFTGVIDDFRYYSKVLEATDVQYIYQSSFQPPGSFSHVNINNWQSLMSKSTIAGSFSITQSGTAPNVQMQLLSSSHGDSQNSLYIQYPIQQNPGFVCTFQIYMTNGADELFFYAGATSPVGCGVSCTGTNYRGLVVGFNVYSGNSGGAGRSGPGIYIMNGTGILVAAAEFSGNSAWETVTIVYTKGTIDTWIVSWKGSTVLTYSDPNNPSWVTSAGSYWGFGGRNGRVTASFYLRQVNLYLANLPSSMPSQTPSVLPSRQPTSNPTVMPSTEPSSVPSLVPSVPTYLPSIVPSRPTSHPTVYPTGRPTNQPSSQPTGLPSLLPTAQPLSSPSVQPSALPSGQPSGQPSSRPSNQPSVRPSSYPSEQPFGHPSSQPSGSPSGQPSDEPTGEPSSQPSSVPSSTPSLFPSGRPSSQPSSRPSDQPSSHPTSDPSIQPTGQPSSQPIGHPSGQPTSFPSSSPSSQPSRVPTGQPSGQPTDIPSSQPSSTPTSKPSKTPTVTPTSSPSVVPSPSPSVTPTLIPTNRPTKAIVIVQPLLTEQQTIEVSSVSGVIGLLIISALIYLFCFSSKAVDERKKRKRLRQLPVHRALLDSKPITSPALAALIESNKASVHEMDLSGDTVLDIILDKKAKSVVSADIVYILLLECLPFDASTGEPSNDRSHGQGWAHCVQSGDEIVLVAVNRLLLEFRSKVKLLANCQDKTGRRAIDIASNPCKNLIFRKLYLHERFDVKEGPPEHCSATSMVYLAKDHYNRLNSLGTAESELLVEPKEVALKFMRNRDQFMKEVELREDGAFDERFVIPVLMKFSDPDFVADASLDRLDSNVDKAFREDSILKGYEEYPYCIVMEAGSQSLKRVIDHERIVGNDLNAIKDITRSLASALDHIHAKLVVHGDLKPLNVLLVSRRIKLIDLDASANMAKQEYVGTKYSSGYIPPEMLHFDEEGEAAVRRGDDLILAHPSQDMWALGCILYYLLSSQSLFHVNTDDNLGSPEDNDILCSWDPDVKEKKLTAIHDKLGKNLVSLLLNKDPMKRPDAKHVLSHPFLTGQRVSRLQGDKADWDIFLSYRVASDSGHVDAFYKSLTDKGFKVWWDKKCLLPGQNWEEGFCSGLMRCANFVCLLSKGAIRNPVSDRSNFEKLTVNSPCDNVLLEWRLALELKERGMIEGVFPILIGNKDADGKYSRYFRSGCHPDAPDTHVVSVERKLREHLDREGLGLPLKETDTVKSVLATVVANQGGFLEGDYTVAVANISNTIELMTNFSKETMRSHSHLRKDSENSVSKPHTVFSPRLASVLKFASIKLSADAASVADLERQRLEQELSIRDSENAQLRQRLVEMEGENAREIEELSQEMANMGAILTTKDARINALVTSEYEKTREVAELRFLLIENGIVVDSVFQGVYGRGPNDGNEEGNESEVYANNVDIEIGYGSI